MNGRWHKLRFIEDERFSNTRAGSAFIPFLFPIHVDEFFRIAQDAIVFYEL
jgi:hypothetical protein